MQPTGGFSSDPVVGAPSARSRSSDAVGQPVAGTEAAAAQLAGLGLGNGSAFFGSGGRAIPIPALPQQPPQQPGFQHSPDSFQASPSHGAARGGQWSPTALQQLLDQQMADQALLQQLQAQLQLDQAMSGAGQGALAQLLQPQLQQQQHQAAAGFQGLPPLATGQAWPGHARSPPPLPAGLPPTQAELPGVAKHAGFGGQEDKKHRGHGSGSGKGRAADADALQGGGSVDRLRREVARLHGELERLEREVGRQKALRETERGEFTDAKDRLKASWAADREDFARVKAQLKAKNATHHAEAGRLSQQLKELEAANRGLRELAARAGLALPPELEVTHARQPPARDAAGGGHAPPSTVGPDSLPSADERSLSRAPSEASFDSDLAERLALRAQPGGAPTPPLLPAAGGSQPPSPTSAAGAVLAMVRQLPRVLAARPFGAQPAGERASDADGLGDNEAAAAAAAQAAAALGQLAAALSGRPAGSTDSQASGRAAAPADAFSSDSAGELGDFPVAATDLNRMSLQAWVQHADASPSGSMSPVSRRSSLPSVPRAQLPEHRSLEFPRVAPQPAPESPRAAARGSDSRPPPEEGGDLPADPSAGAAQP